MKKNVKKPNYEAWPRKKVNIQDLFLDPQNIRLPITSNSQDSLINDLFINENAMQILENIAKHNFFPDEIPVAIVEKGKITIIDGNRRVAALKALSKPQIVPQFENKIKAFKSRYGGGPNKIEIVIAPDRDSVRYFLASKHTQNTKRPWSTLRQAFFYKAELTRGKTVEQLINDYPGVDIVRFLKMINVHKIAKSIDYDSDYTAIKVYDERKFPISTIERLYEDKNVRQFLGISFDKFGEFHIEIKKSEFEKGFKKIVEDIVNKIVDSRYLNSEKNRKNYIDTFPEESAPNRESGEKSITSKNFKEKAEPKIDRRKGLAPKNVVFSLNAPGVKRMLIELQDINYHRFPIAAHDLLRSFLECALKAYLEQINETVLPKRDGGYVYLDDVLEKFKQKMDSVRNRELSQVAQRIKNDKTMKPETAQFLNATNHNPSIFPKYSDVEVAWDTMEKLIRFIVDPK